MRRAAQITSCAVVAAFLLVTTAPAQRIIYVDDDAPGPGDGSSWENAYRHLQDALAEANTAEQAVEIRIAQGTYRPSAAQNEDGQEASFRLTTRLTLQGGFAGSGAPDPNARDVTLHRTILTGDVAGNDDQVTDPCDLADDPSRADNSQHVVYAESVSHVTLDGLVIAGGQARRPPPPPEPRVRGAEEVHFSGGGLLAIESNDLTFSNCIFTDNSAPAGGGLSLVGCGRVEFFDSAFTANSAMYRGGAMAAETDHLRLTGCEFTDNWTTQGAGGAIHILRSEAVLSGCHLALNSASEYGGAVQFEASTVRLAGCVFQGNTTRSGGALAICGCEDVKMENCRLTGNRATENGGAALIWGSRASLLNCTVLGNRAAKGRFLAQATCFCMCPPVAWDISVNSCIVSNGANEVWNDVGNIRILYSLITVHEATVHDHWGTAVIGPGNIDVDPCFVDPGHWDEADTPEDPNDDTWVDGDYHLKAQAGRWGPASESWVKDDASSPCIDAGDPHTSCARELWPHGWRLNMGAFGNTNEASLSSSEYGSPVDLNNDAIVNFQDFTRLGAMWLRPDVRGRENLNGDSRVDAHDLGIVSKEWLGEPPELRFTDYWPFAVKTGWRNVNVVCGASGMEIGETFSVNGFDVWRITEGWSSLFDSGTKTAYYVYVNGGLYSTSSRASLEHLPDVSEGYLFRWPEFVQVGVLFTSPFGEFVAVRMTLRQLAARVAEEQPQPILKHFPPEDHSLDVLAFCRSGRVSFAFARNYGPVFDNAGTMVRYSTQQ